MIAENMNSNPNDRRSVLQMWSADLDLGRVSKDLPCNTTATFQVSHDGKLDMCVFNRSNDIVWGAYGANAVHFAMLLEYMALWAGYPVGQYRQISVNYHCYSDQYDKHYSLIQKMDAAGYLHNPYHEGQVRTICMTRANGVNSVDRDIRHILHQADLGNMRTMPIPAMDPWMEVMWIMMMAHEAYRDKKDDGSHYAEA